MSIILRHEQPQDYRYVEEMTKRAFWNLYVPGCNEHYLTHIIRQHKDYEKDLSFMAVKDDKIVGHIMYTQSMITGNNGIHHKIATFGPICVEPAYQKQGIGHQLITHTIQLAKEKQYSAIAIFGFPNVYTRYGFKNGKHFGVHAGDDHYPAGLLILPLSDNKEQDISGQVHMSEVFLIDPKEVEAFDKDFFQLPKKEEYWHEDFYIMANASL